MSRVERQLVKEGGKPKANQITQESESFIERDCVQFSFH